MTALAASWGRVRRSGGATKRGYGMSATCSKCETHLFFTADGAAECPICDWLPAYDACARLGIKPAELEAAVRALVKALAISESLIAEELEPADSEIASPGVDAVRAVLTLVRATLASFGKEAHQ